MRSESKCSACAEVLNACWLKLARAISREALLEVVVGWRVITRAIIWVLADQI